MFFYQRSFNVGSWQAAVFLLKHPNTKGNAWRVSGKTTNPTPGSSIHSICKCWQHAASETKNETKQKMAKQMLCTE
jgi:hypothetical protein